MSIELGSISNFGVILFHSFSFSSQLRFPHVPRFDTTQVKCLTSVIQEGNSALYLLLECTIITSTEEIMLTTSSTRLEEAKNTENIDIIPVKKTSAKIIKKLKV